MIYATLTSGHLRFTILGMALMIGCVSGGDPSTSTSGAATDIRSEDPQSGMESLSQPLTAWVAHMAVAAPDFHWTRTGPCEITSDEVPGWAAMYDDRGLIRRIPDTRRLTSYQSCQCGYEPYTILVTGWVSGTDRIETSVTVPFIPCEEAVPVK